MVMFQFRSLGGFASAACLLLAACSAPEEPEALESGGNTSAPGAPAPPSPDGSSPVPTLPPAPLDGLRQSPSSRQNAQVSCGFDPSHLRLTIEIVDTPPGGSSGSA